MISMIVPCYNVEKFIEDCVKSIDAQTYKNFEVIFINDGSKDGTLELLKKLCAGKENYIVLDQENAGQSVARNRGVEVSNGEFICFCDSDDIVSPFALETLHTMIVQTNADIAVYRPKWIKEEAAYDKMKFKRKELNAKVFESADTLVSMLYYGKLGYGPCNKLYRKSILQKMEGYPNVFNTKSHYGEDTEFVTMYLSISEKLAFSKQKLYLYRQRKGSVVHSKFNERKLSVFNGLDRAEALDDEKFKNAKVYIKGRRATIALEMLFRMSRTDYRKKEVIQKLYNDYKHNVKYLTKGRKNPGYMRAFMPLVLPVLKLMFFKYLKKDKKIKKAK